MILEINNLSFSYGNKRVLEDISFSASSGEFVSILGANGAGKTTLFKCILNIIGEYGGSILLDGEDVSKIPPAKLSRKIAYIPQDSSMMFNYSVQDIIMMGTTAGLGYFAVPGKEEERKTLSVMEKMGLSKYKDECFHHLSGGERKLAVIARALVQDAKILLLDEPASSLDLGNQTKVLSELKKLSKEGYVLLQTTHNPDHSYMYSNKIIALKDGRVLKSGTPEDVIDKETLSLIYKTNIDVESIRDDKIRVCVPSYK